jgi:hypothetical protein
MPRERSNIPFYIISWDVIYIRDGIGGEKCILYIVDDCTRLYFVFIFLNNKLDSLLKYLRGVVAYVLRQYNLVIKKWKHDWLPTLVDSLRYNDWILEEGYVLEIFALYI